MSRIKSAVIIAGLIAIAIAVTGCEVVGYDTPLPGSSSSSWQSFESIDPDTGEKLISVRTHTASNSFFGKILSIFGRPSLTISCASEATARATIDWREAIGPPNMNRIVYQRLDGGTVADKTWKTSLSGRETKTDLGGLERPLGIDKDHNVIAVRTVNSGGNNVSLLFNVSGLQNVVSAVQKACN